MSSFLKRRKAGVQNSPVGSCSSLQQARRAAACRRAHARRAKRLPLNEVRTRAVGRSFHLSICTWPRDGARSPTPAPAPPPGNNMAADSQASPGCTVDCSSVRRLSGAWRQRPRWDSMVPCDPNRKHLKMFHSEH